MVERVLCAAQESDITTRPEFVKVAFQTVQYATAANPVKPVLMDFLCVWECAQHCGMQRFM